MWIKLWHFGFKQLPPCIKLPLIKVVGMEMNKPEFVKTYTKLVVCYEKRRRKLQVIQEQRAEQARKCIEMNDREVEEKTKSYGNSDHSTLSDALVQEALKSCGGIPSLSIKRKTRSALAVYRLGRLRRTFLNMLGVGTLLAGVILALYYDIIPSSTCVHGRTYGWDDDSNRASYMPNERVVTAIENPSAVPGVAKILGLEESLNSDSPYGEDKAKVMEYEVIQEVDKQSAERLKSPSTRTCAVWKRPSPSDEKFSTRDPCDLGWKKQERMRHKAALGKHQDPSERQAYLSALTEDYVKFCYNLHDVHDELRNKPSVKRTYDLEKCHTRWSYDGNNLTPYEIGGNSSSTEWLDANALWEKQRLRTWQQQYCLEGNASGNGTGGDGTTS